ncbi:MAG: hypothetical protein HC836_31360, partial [Richelia sp. RM2_1_2]|nr:hypothetical protein [Richelia sp. RM2_1_2]
MSRLWLLFIGAVCVVFGIRGDVALLRLYIIGGCDLGYGKIIDGCDLGYGKLLTGVIGLWGIIDGCDLGYGDIIGGC